MQVQSLSWEDFLKKEMATHSSILAWKISWTEEGPWSRKESETIEHACSIIQRHTLNRLGKRRTGEEAAQSWGFRLEDSKG